jgi:hypothetical protein
MPKNTGKNLSLLAMVVLNKPSMPSPQALFNMLPKNAVDANSLHIKNDAFVFGFGENNAAIALMPTPIPWSNLEGPCATAWWWPKASEKMKNHTSHILITLLGKESDLVKQNIMLTQLTAAVASLTDAAGIYWGAGTLVHAPNVFIEQSRELIPGDLPLHLWIDFRVEANDDGSYRLFTTGMKAFDKMEIEIPHSQREPKEVFDFAYAIADYIITRNPKIDDGHTIGRSETEKVKAVYSPSMWDSKVTVLRLDF